MSDEKSPSEEQTAVEAKAQEPVIAGTSAKSNIPPAVALAFVIIALLGVLIVTVLKNGSWHSSSGNADLATLQAEANAIRSETNRERVAMGLRPIEVDSEPLENIAARLKKDADTLVALAGSYQKLLEEKDGELTARNAEILRSEKLRQSLAAESARLQAELQRALVSGSDSDLLRRDLADVKAQRDTLSAELSAARQKSAGVSADDFADLKRRYEEALHAKEFFEARVKELEVK